MLTPQKQRQILWLASTLVLVATVAVSTVLITLPMPQDQPLATANKPQAESESTMSSQDLPPLDAFKPLWDHNYRRPLYDPVIKEKAKPPFQAQLAGTVIEPGYTRAMFTVGKNQIEFKAVGETIANATVLAIHAKEVQILYEGEEITLKLPQGDAP